MTSLIMTLPFLLGFVTGFCPPDFLSPAFAHDLKTRMWRSAFPALPFLALVWLLSQRELACMCVSALAGVGGRVHASVRMDARVLVLLNGTPCMQHGLLPRSLQNNLLYTSCTPHLHLLPTSSKPPLPFSTPPLNLLYIFSTPPLNLLHTFSTMEALALWGYVNRDF